MGASDEAALWRGAQVGLGEMKVKRRSTPSWRAAAATVLALALAVATARAGTAEPAARAQEHRAMLRPKLVELVRLSGESPLTGCEEADSAATNHEFEAELAVDPADADHLVAAWQQDRYASGGGARGNVVAASFDGGETWTVPTPVRGAPSCGDGTGEPVDTTRATDPDVAIGVDGVAYLSSLGIDGVNNLAVQLVNTSPDGGRTWNVPPAVLAVEGPVPGTADALSYFEELPVIAADPRRPGQLYRAWERLVVENVDKTALVDGHIRFSRYPVDDGDATPSWSEPTTIAAADAPALTESPFRDIVVTEGPGGGTRLVVAGARMQPLQRKLLEVPGPFELFTAVSDDLGETWSVHHVGASIVTFPESDVVDGTFVVAHKAALDLAVAPDGTVYGTWYERTATGTGPGGTDIKLARSVDGGQTWSVETALSLPHQAFTPLVAVAGDGTIGILWYDARHFRLGDDAFLGEVRLATSSGGGQWSELALTEPFDIRCSRLDPFYRLGDYQGFEGLPNGFAAAFVTAQPGGPQQPCDADAPERLANPTEVWFAKVLLKSPR